MRCYGLSRHFTGSGGNSRREAVRIRLAEVKYCIGVLMACPALPGEEMMAKSNMEDGIADAIAATALISVGLVTLIVWLSGLPS